MNKIVISLCTLLICEANFFANAQDTSSQLKNKIALNGELLCDTWQIDASYHYFVLPYIGFGGSIGMWKQYTVDGIPSGRGWTVDEDYENVENFFIHPSISLVSPCVAKIEELSETKPELVVAYAYTRFLADLFGGRTFLSLLSTSYKISNEGLNYYQFPEINDLRGYVMKYHNMLADINLSDEMKVDFINEVNNAYIYNLAISNELEIKLHPIKRNDKNKD